MGMIWIKVASGGVEEREAICELGSAIHRGRTLLQYIQFEEEDICTESYVGAKVT